MAVGPAPLVLQRLGQIEVVEVGQGGNACRQQLVDQPVIEIETFLVDRAPALRKNARPGNTESKGLQAQLFHQGHVFPIAVILVAGYVAGVAVLDMSRLTAEAIPDRLASAVLIPGAFRLVCGRGASPVEAIRKLQY